jgi:hypothetical protein
MLVMYEVPRYLGTVPAVLVMLFCTRVYYCLVSGYSSTFIPCIIVLHFGVGARPFRDMPLYSKGRSTSVAARGRLA